MKKKKSSDASPYDLPESLAFLSGRLFALLRRKLQEELEAANVPVSVEEFPLLVQLWNRGDLSQAELSRALGKDTPRISRLLDGLERRGMIERRAAVESRREKRIRMTSSGRTVAKRAMNVARETNASALAGFSASEQKTMLKMLVRAVRELDSTPNEQENGTP